MATPDAGKGPLEVVVVYAFDQCKAPAAYDLVDLVYFLVQDKIGGFSSSSRLSYIVYTTSPQNSYVIQKRFARSRAAILAQSKLPCTKNMVCGLHEAHRLISQQCEHPNPNGIILLVSDGLMGKGDFFDGAENFISTWPVHTFTVGGDAYNKGLRAIASNSPGGTFYPLPVPADPKGSAVFSQWLHNILFNPPTRNNTGSSAAARKGLDLVVVMDIQSNLPGGDIKLSDMKAAMELVIMKLSPTDRLSVVTGSNHVDGLRQCPLRWMTPDGQADLKALVNGLTYPSVNLQDSLVEALAVLHERDHNEGRNTFIFFLTDDYERRGNARSVDPGDVAVHTFGFGSRAGHDMLKDIAKKSPGGTYTFVADDSSLCKPFSQLLDSSILMNDDEKPATWNSGSTKSLVCINEVKYFKDDAALTADMVTAEVEIKATDSTVVREGLDLVVVLDVSGRMEKKMESVKNAMKFVIMKLTPVDRLSIVVFSNGATRLNPLRSMTTDAHNELAALVDGLTTHGGTNIRAGLETGLAVIAGRVNTKARTANIFLMSDGKQTVSDARKVNPGSISVYTFGFGNDTDNHLLSDLAGRSHGGMFSAVPDGADLSGAFSPLLGGLLTVVAQDVRLTLTPNNKQDEGDVDIDRMVVAPGTDYTQATDTATGEITIKFGTLFAGERRRVVVTLDLKDSTKTEDYDATLGEAQHMFTAQGKAMLKQTPQDIQILRVPNPSQAPSASDKSRQLQAELARRAQAAAIRDARLLADAGDLDEARYKLVDAQNALEDIMLNDGEKLVGALRTELVQLIGLMDTKKDYEEKGRAYALAAEASHGRQRYAARGGGGDDDVGLFSTPRMEAYREQANNFEKDPTAPVPSADEDLKKEIAANPLAAISGDFAYYLRNAIEALQAMHKIIDPTA